MNDALHLPLFSDEDRAVVHELESKLDGHRWADPEIDDSKALKESVATLGEWGTLTHTVADPWRLMPVVLIREALAFRSGIADLGFIMQALGGLPILIAGNDAQKSDVLPRIADGTAIAAFAITEPDAGTDLSRLALRAERQGDEYVLNGKKHLISNVGVATHYSIFARTSDEGRGISAFILPADTDGLTLEQQRPMSPHPLGRMVLRDVRVPAANLLGKEGDGMGIALKTLARCRVTVAAAANGYAQRAMHQLVLNMTDREMFDGTLADQPIAQSILSEMKARLEASRMLTYRAAYEFDRGDTRNAMNAGIAKWQSTENAQWIIDKALQLSGGRGCLQGSVFERLYREIRPLRIYEGASEVQQIIIAREYLNQMTTGDTK